MKQLIKIRTIINYDLTMFIITIFIIVLIIHFVNFVILISITTSLFNNKATATAASLVAITNFVFMLIKKV